MTDFPDYIPPKEELRTRLPLPYVCARLGIHLNREGRAVCPFHADDDPSFYLWEGDDGVPRYSCHPCGLLGDVFDLIQRSGNLSFAETMQQAASFYADLPPGYEPPRLALPPPSSGPADWGHEVQEARDRAAQPSHAGILSARVGYASVDDPNLCAAWDVYLRGTWGWGLDADGTVLFPHWDADGQLTGCKLRKGTGARESKPGSRYTALYGAWLGRRYRDVLLTEGETDAAYAGWAAAQERIDLDVFALPRGAKANVETQWLTFLQGARTIYLAFDPDAAGVDATRMWIKALVTATFPNIRVCCLPLGQDLRAARPTLRSLLDRARSPLEGPGDIIQDPGGYTRVDAKGNPRPVTTWTVEPRAQLAGGDDPGYDVHILSRGTATPTVLRLSDLANTAALNRWANRHSEIFTGTESDRQRIAEFIQARGSVTPEIFQTDKVGLHKPPTGYAFAGASCVFPGGYIGKLPWRYAPTPQKADVSKNVLLPVARAAEGFPPPRFDWRWLEYFLALAPTEKTHPLLAWLVAATRRHEVPQFPIIFLSGSSGSGKTTVAELSCRLLGSEIRVDMGSSSPYVLLQKLATATTLPVFVDEWTKLSRRDTRETFQGLIPSLYAGETAGRGQSDLSTIRYELAAPTLVAGEDTFQLDRENDRMVVINLSRGDQNALALHAVQGQPIERFGQLLHGWVASSYGRDTLPPLLRAPTTRPEYNRQVLEGGWATLTALLAYAAAHGDDVPELPTAPDLTGLDAAQHAPRENVYETAVAEGVPMRDQNGVLIVWSDAQGRGTWVRFRMLIGALKTRNVDLDLPGGSRAMKAYFEERYQVTDERVQPPYGEGRVSATLIHGLVLDEPDPRATWTG